MSLWAAITVTLAASACMNLGLVLQKRGLSAHSLETTEVAGDRTAGPASRYRSKPIWYLGMTLLLGGYAVYAFALSSRAAPISLLQPLSASGVLVVAVMAVVYLHERFDSLEWVGVALLLAGVILLGFSAENSPRWTGSINTSRWFAFLAVVAVATLSAFVVVRRAGTSTRSEFLYGILTGLLLGTGYLHTKIVALAVQARRLDLLILAACCMTFGLIVGLAVLQMGFRRGRALIVTAVNLVTNQVLVVAGGLICLGERFPSQPGPFAARVAGLGGIFAGIVLLARLSASASSRAGATAQLVPLDPEPGSSPAA